MTSTGPAVRLGGVALLVAAVLLAGCAELMPSSIRPVQGGQVSLRQLLDPDSLAVLGLDTDDVIDALGRPDSSETRETPDDAPPGTITTMRYDGLEVVVHELERPQRAFISELVISSEAYVTNLPFGVGASRRDVEQALGEPSSEEEDGDVVYDLSDDGDRCIVTYDGDRATRMTLRFS